MYLYTLSVYYWSLGLIHVHRCHDDWRFDIGNKSWQRTPVLFLNPPVRYSATAPNYSHSHNIFTFTESFLQCFCWNWHFTSPYWNYKFKIVGTVQGRGLESISIIKVLWKYIKNSMQVWEIEPVTSSMEDEHTP
jgi:hypothetical protein